jgi:FtsP/CotA-like multicopper oxidase with cupredoxin domain
MKFTRRQILKYGLAGGAGLLMPWKFRLPKADAVRLAKKLSDPAAQPKFVNPVPNALDPGFKYTPDISGEFTVGVGPTTQMTGLLNPGGTPVPTPLFGYGQGGVYTWPGKTFEVQSGASNTIVNWENNLFGITEHLLPLDKSLHWAYSLPGYKEFTIANTGIAIIVHLHGGHTDFQYDGNPEFFFNPGAAVVGPQWADVPGGFTNSFVYDNNVPAGNLWYHDHALGITRLNVYAGMAGFYFVRDDMDTGLPGNPLDLPFYPALPPDPFWDDFITGEGLKNGDVPKPSALAEFFGDHMVVNGLIWPKADVEPRNYRLRLLNGCDSRFMAIQFVAVDPGVTDPNDSSASAPLPFWVIGSDQGLGTPAMTDTLVIEPGGRYDVVVDFSQVPYGSRIIMKNLGGDAPFGGAFGDALEPADLFPDRQTDRVMAFDVVVPPSGVPDNFNPANLASAVINNANGVDNIRRVALFEGTDEFGRLQPLLGTVKDGDLNTTNVATAYTWFQPTTETPDLNSTEIWEIYNFTADAHPIHLHLVNFEILDRENFEYDSTETQITTQHNGTEGEAPQIDNIRNFSAASVGSEYFEDAPKDMVTSLPGDPEGDPPTGQLVRIKAEFNKSGRYVWHCHILSHEDHEMMRVLHVG